MCAFLPCHKEIIAQKGKKKRESCYKSGIWGTNFESRLQNVKLDYKTGTSLCNRPLEEARILCYKIGDKKSKFHDIRKKNLTIYADTKKEQVNKE